MKAIIQRVTEAKVTVEGNVIGEIRRGLLIFMGFGGEDTREIADKYIDKILKFRIFQDENGKTNQSLKDVEGEILVVSQFTLYANSRKGNRPDFLGAAPPEKARELYAYVLDQIREKYGAVQSGSFGADMKISLVNDGPFTLILDEKLFG